MPPQSSLFHFPKFKQAYPQVFLLSLLVLTSLDLMSKYYITQTLSFQLTNRQRQGYLTNIKPNQRTPAELQTPETIPILGNGGRILRLKLYFNDQNAFSTGSVQNLATLIRSLLIILGLNLIYCLLLTTPNSFLYQAGWALILSGATANFIDRLFIKSLTNSHWHISLKAIPGNISGVTDFIDLIWFNSNAFVGWPFANIWAWKRWPTFNLADTFLLIGILLIGYKFVKENRYK